MATSFLRRTAGHMLIALVAVLVIGGVVWVALSMGTDDSEAGLPVLRIGDTGPSDPEGMGAETDAGGGSTAGDSAAGSSEVTTTPPPSTGSTTTSGSPSAPATSEPGLSSDPEVSEPVGTTVVTSRVRVQSGRIEPNTTQPSEDGDGTGSPSPGQGTAR